MKSSGRGLKESFSEFIPSLPVSIFFVAVSVFNVFSKGETVLEIAIMNLGLIFTLAFAYIGYKYASGFMNMMNRRRMFIIFIAVALLLSAPTLIQILSYVGVYFSVIVSKNNTEGLDEK